MPPADATNHLPVLVNRRNVLVGLLVATAVVGVFGTLKLWEWQKSVGPVLVVNNLSGKSITVVKYRDTRSGSIPSQPVTWPTINAGAHVVHRIRADDMIELQYTLDGVTRTHTGYTPVGPLEAWVISIHADGSATTDFGRVKDY